MGLSAGRLRHRITILRPEQAQNVQGGYDATWVEVATVYAEVIGISGREAVIEHALQGISVFRITMRHRSDILDSFQLRNGTQLLNIKSAIDPDGRREQLVILADTQATVSTV